jgi:hypothetical protein
MSSWRPPGEVWMGDPGFPWKCGDKVAWLVEVGTPPAPWEPLKVVLTPGGEQHVACPTMVAPWISHEDQAEVRAAVAHVRDFVSELLGTVCEAGLCAASDCEAVAAKLDTVLERLDAPPPPPVTS